MSRRRRSRTVVVGDDPGHGRPGSPSLGTDRRRARGDDLIVQHHPRRPADGAPGHRPPDRRVRGLVPGRAPPRGRDGPTRGRPATPGRVDARSRATAYPTAAVHTRTAGRGRLVASGAQARRGAPVVCVAAWTRSPTSLAAARSRHRDLPVVGARRGARLEARAQRLRVHSGCRRPRADRAGRCRPASSSANVDGRCRHHRASSPSRPGQRRTRDGRHRRPRWEASLFSPSPSRGRLPESS